MKKIILASNNLKKIKEIKEILKGYPYEIYSLKDMSIDIDVEEDGLTFEDNAKKKAMEIHQYLLNKGADKKKNALVVAVTKNNYDLVQILLKNGADVNQKNEKGITAIMAACYSENYEEEPGINTRKQYRIIRVLIEKGADISLKDNKGNTVEKSIQQYRKNIENGNHEYTESLYKLIKSYKIN